MKRRYAILGGVLALVAILTTFSIWRIALHRATPKPVVGVPPAKPLNSTAEQPKVNSPVDIATAALDEPSELQAVELPLRKALQLLSKRHHVPIELDEAAIGEVGVSPDTPVTRHVSGVRLRSVLRLVLKELELTHGVQGGKIVVTTSAAWEGKADHYIIREYSLTSLVGGAHKVTEQHVADMVQATIEPHTWWAESGRGEISVLPKTLQIRQLPEVHEQIVLLLARLAEESGRRESVRDLSPVHLDKAGERHWRSIVAALDKPTSLDVVEQPLQQVFSELAKRHGISIQIDTKALDGVGVSSDTPISRQLAGISLRSVLNLVLRDLELNYLVKDDVLQITTPEVADAVISIRIYPIGDLLKPALSIDADALIDGIVALVPPSGWDDGDVGSIVACAGCLVVSQTQEVHQLCEEFLANLRRALGPAAVGEPMSFPEPSAMVQQIEAALAKPISLKSERTPLGDVMRQLKKDLGIELQMDIRALDGIGVKYDTPITLEVKDMLLAATLGELLTPLQLHYQIHDEVLHITTREVADLTLENRWYRLRDLVGGSRGLTLEKIEGLVRDAMTKEPGEGHGKLIFLKDVMIAQQTQEGQQAIAHLLARIATPASARQ